MENLDNSTLDTIESIIAIGVDYGVDIVGAIVMLVVGWTIAGWVRRSVRHALEREPRMDESLKPFLAKLVWYLIMIFVMVAVLNQFGVQTTSLIAVLGAAGLAIGLALQGTLALLPGLLDGDGRVLDDPESLVVVHELGDSAVIIKLRGWTKAGDYWNTVWDLNKAIKIDLQAAGYSIPFPQRDIHIVSGGNSSTGE